MQVYVVEMQLVTSEIDAYEEVADYTTAEMFRFVLNEINSTFINIYL